MAKWAIGCGGALVILGLGGYFGTQRVSATALIPVFFGVPLIALGTAAARATNRGRMHIMHAAAAVGLLGLLGAAGRAVPRLGALVAGQVERPTALILQLAMAGLCLVFVAGCVKSFIDARRARVPRAHA